MNDRQALSKTAEANQVASLLEHAGWTDVIKPQIDQLRESLQSLLVSSVLGRAVTSMTPAGPVIITKEELAGQIEGLKFVEDLFTRILREGERAKDYLADYNDRYEVN